MMKCKLEEDCVHSAETTNLEGHTSQLIRTLFIEITV